MTGCTTRDSYAIQTLTRPYVLFGDDVWLTLSHIGLGPRLSKGRTAHIAYFTRGPQSPERSGGEGGSSDEGDGPAVAITAMAKAANAWVYASPQACTHTCMITPPCCSVCQMFCLGRCQVPCMCAWRGLLVSQVAWARTTQSGTHGPGCGSHVTSHLLVL